MTEPTENHTSMALRNPDGTWARGPDRKPGSKNKVSRAAIEKIKGMSGKAFEQLEMNLERGDMRAVEFVLNRVLPAGRALEIDTTPGGIRDHLAEGDFSDSEAGAVASIIEKLARLEKLEELESRFAEMERLLKQGSVEL